MASSASIDIKVIKPNPFQPPSRLTFPPAEVERMAKSIFENGLLQIPIVRYVEKECQMADGWLRLSGYRLLAEKLPMPTIQQPGLLAPEAKPVRVDCAEAVVRDGQSPVINQMMAGLVLTFVHKLLAGTLTWMAAYIDLESGSLSTVDAEPETVARMTGLTGLTVRQVEYRPRELRERMQVRV